jgi:serine/threonine-protein kinase
VPQRTIAGKYRLYHRLGFGGMAEVYLAKQLGAAGFEKLVAVKMMRTDRDAPGLAAMFIDEARLAAQLTHANIVQVYDFGEAEGAFYLVMEYVHGVSLGRLLRLCADRGVAFPLALTTHVMRSVCRALDYAHRRTDLNGKPLGVIHRDVDPQNIFLDFEGEVKLGDFGIARAANRLHQTTDGALRGKINYMAPEMVQDRPLDQRADLFSLGVTYFQTVAGQLPFDGENQLRTLENLRLGRWRSIGELRPQLPPEIGRTIERAMAFRREDRFGSAAEMLAAIEGYPAPLLPGDGAQLLRAFFQTHFADLLGPPPLAMEEDDGGGHTRVMAEAVVAPEPAPPTQAPLASTATPGKKSTRGLWRGAFVALAIAGLTVVVAIARLATPQPAAEAPSPPTAPSEQATPTEASPGEVVAEPTPETQVEAGESPAKIEKTAANVTPSQSAATGFGQLSVGADVGCEVRVDGQPIGSTPIAARRVSAGAHVVACANAALGATVSQTVTVDAGAIKNVSLRLMATLSVSAKPWAEVYVDGVKLGDTPLNRGGIKPGAHEIRLVNPALGKQTTTTRRFDPGETVTVTESFLD